MGVSPSYRSFVLDQLGRVATVTAKNMFGGVGIYSRGLFFALMDDDMLYLKVDDGNRPDFERLGAGPFMPTGDPAQVMQYYALPADILENVEELSVWVSKSVEAARRRKAAGKRPSHPPRGQRGRGRRRDRS
jgi:DNA transformation protein